MFFFLVAVITAFSKLEILSDFDDNLREFKITVISRGANNNAMIELNSDIDLNEMIIKLKDNKSS